MFVAVTGQACGLAAWMRGGAVLLELAPGLDGPYQCTRGWDMKPPRDAPTHACNQEK